MRYGVEKDKVYVLVGRSNLIRTNRKVLARKNDILCAVFNRYVNILCSRFVCKNAVRQHRLIVTAGFTVFICISL